MKNERQRTQDLNHLSAFLDDSLSKSQLEQLESRLAQDAELRMKLENLRKTKIILGRLPRLHAPKNFTLTPDMVTLRKPKAHPLFAPLQIATALAAILLVVVFGSELLLGSGLLTGRLMTEAPAPESALALDSTPQPLIQWGVPDNAGFGTGGMGGGPQGGGIDPYVFEQPVEEMRKAEESGISEEEGMLESVPEIEAEPAPAMGLAPEEPEEMDMLSAQEQGADSVADSKDLILGINAEQAGEIISQSKPSGQLEQPVSEWRSMVRWIEIILAVIMAGGGLTLLLLRKKRPSS